MERTKKTVLYVVVVSVICVIKGKSSRRRDSSASNYNAGRRRFASVGAFWTRWCVRDCLQNLTRRRFRGREKTAGRNMVNSKKKPQRKRFTRLLMSDSCQTNKLSVWVNVSITRTLSEQKLPQNKNMSARQNATNIEPKISANVQDGKWMAERNWPWLTIMNEAEIFIW
jgi:hypothetical protein